MRRESPTMSRYESLREERDKLVALVEENVHIKSYPMRSVLVDRLAEIRRQLKEMHHEQYHNNKRTIS